MIPPSPALEAAFFERDTVTVARELLGCRLMRRLPALSEDTGFKKDFEVWQAFRIVETEAYTANDPACHAYGRRTGRAEMLYMHPGTAYVYLIYGIHHCLNVVTEPFDVAGAVLFRALEPLHFAEASPSAALRDAFHPRDISVSARTNGPGRLTRALDITRQAFNGCNLLEPETGLYLAPGTSSLPSGSIVQTSRIGITKAVDYPWRFYEQGNPWVSVIANEKEKKQKLKSPF